MIWIFDMIDILSFVTFLSLFAGSPQTASLAEKWWFFSGCWSPGPSQLLVMKMRFTMICEKHQFDAVTFDIRLRNRKNDGSNRWFSTTSTGLKESLWLQSCYGKESSEVSVCVSGFVEEKKGSWFQVVQMWSILLFVSSGCWFGGYYGMLFNKQRMDKRWTCCKQVWETTDWTKWHRIHIDLWIMIPSKALQSLDRLWLLKIGKKNQMMWLPQCFLHPEVPWTF